MVALKRIKNLIRIVILILALGLTILGISGKGFQDVRNKAIRICYECMGIG